MLINRLTVGPILGETTNSRAKIFGRGEYEMSNGQPRRGHLVIRHRRSNVAQWSAPAYFKLNPNFDMSSVAVLENLSPSQSYEYQCGYIFSEVPTEDINVSSILEWDNIPTESFRTGTTENKDRTVIVGSCRYILRLLGGTLFDSRGDKTFRSIFRSHEKHPVDAMIMAGDQIYADDLNVVGQDESVDDYLKRYRMAFTQPHIRKLMSSVPTYMTLDDHEIEDNWPASASPKDMVTKYPAAMHSYQIYQMSHSPLYPVDGGKITSPPEHLWYTHTDGCCDYFFTDCRTERDIANSMMISQEQMNALKAWLKDGSNRVKMIISPVPPYESTGKDKWNGFIDQRDEILQTIESADVKRVMFLSGDVHACMASELNLGNAKVVSVVSSAFFWPYPHPKASHFVLKGNIATNSGNTYTVQNASRVHANDMFCRLQISPSNVKVEFFARKGRLKGSKTFQF